MRHAEHEPPAGQPRPSLIEERVRDTPIGLHSIIGLHYNTLEREPRYYSQFQEWDTQQGHELYDFTSGISSVIYGSRDKPARYTAYRMAAFSWFVASLSGTEFSRGDARESLDLLTGIAHKPEPGSLEARRSSSVRVFLRAARALDFMERCPVLTQLIKDYREVVAEGSSRHEPLTRIIAGITFEHLEQRARENPYDG